ncbi:MAG: hypothetical protein ACC631_03650, partial [Halocynthiibacter sp.]
MAINTAKKRLLCYVTHSPLFESCFPVLERLHRRGRIEVDLVLARRLLKTDPGLRDVFASTGLRPRLQSRARIELLSFSEMKRADAVLVHTDPYGNRKNSRLRDRFLPASRTPAIFVQHGLTQGGVNWEWQTLGHHWYADLLLWWESFDPEKSGFIKDDIRARVRRVGFIKKSFIAPRGFAPPLAGFLSQFRTRLLVCTCFPGQEFRFSDQNLKAAYEMFARFCRQNPDVLLLLRPHRGKQDTRGRDLDEALL